MLMFGVWGSWNSVVEPMTSTVQIASASEERDFTSHSDKRLAQVHHLHSMEKDQVFNNCIPFYE